ncbi:MAG: L-2-amino-thiazoline-4-carboxylic acid hydrolase [bacterium]|nr:L-2-amino-thiazoline-4-carboxylic acid hydrolase [bacterium]
MKKKQVPENQVNLSGESSCDSPSRRGFLLKSLVSGCGASLLLSLPATANDTKSTPDDCNEKLENQKLSFNIANAKREAILVKKLKDKFGDDIVTFLKQDTIDSTAKRYKNSKKITERNLTGIKKYLWDNLGKGVEFTCVKDTPEYLEFKVTKCYIADAYREIKVDKEIGLALNCAWDYGYSKGINPDIKFTRTKTLLNGDCCCNHTYQLKKS